MDIEPVAQFGKLDQQPLIGRLMPSLCLGIFIAAWARYYFASEIGFNFDESTIFTCIALGTLQLTRGRWLYAFATGLFLWLYGVLAFGDFALVMEKGSFASAGPWVRTGFSPNGAVIIAALGLSMSVLSREFRRRFQTLLGLILGFLAAAISLVAVWGHFNGVQAAYTWSKFSGLSWSASTLYLLCAIAAIWACKSSGDPALRPSGRSTAMALGLASSVAATLIIAAMFGDMSDRRTFILSGEMGAARKSVEEQKDALSKSLRRLASGVASRGKNSFEGLAQQLIKEFTSIRAVEISNGKDVSPLVYPHGVEIDDWVSQGLIAEMRNDKRGVNAKIVQRGAVWRMIAATVGADGGTVVIALIDLKDFFGSIVASVPDQTGVKISYAGDEIVSRDYHGPDDGREFHDLSFMMFGWPGWRISLVPGPSFDQIHAVSGIFRMPLMLLVTAGSIAWAWAVTARARIGQMLVEEINNSVRNAGPLNERALTALDGIREFVIMCDTNEQVVYFNLPARSMLRPVSAEKGHFLGDFFTLQTLEEMRSVGFITARQKGTWNAVGTIRSTDSSELPMSIRIIPNPHPSGGITGYSLLLGSLHAASGDSTLKVMSGTPVWAFADATSMPIWVAGNEGVIEFGNRKLLSTLGVTLEQFRETWPLQFCHPDDIDGLKAAGVRLGQHRRRIRSVAAKFSWYEESVTAIKKPDGTVLGYIGSLSEVGRERHLVEQIQLNEYIISGLAQYESEVFWVHDQIRNKITWVSAGFEKLWGIRIEELKLNPDAWKSELKASISIPDEVSRDGTTLEYIIRRDDGTDAPVRHSLWSIAWNDGIVDERYMVHAVSYSEGLPTNVNAPVQSGATRELRNEVEHLYSFLAKHVYESARQIGSLGQLLADENTDNKSESTEDTLRLRREAELLISWMREFSEVTKVQRFDTNKIEKDFQGTTVAEVLERLGSAHNSLPANVAFSGDLSPRITIAREMIEFILRSVASFVTDRAKDQADLDIRINVRRDANNYVIECSLGTLPIDRDELSKAFLPACEMSSNGRAVPSLAVVNAVSRKFNGRAWLVRTTSGNILLNILLRPDPVMSRTVEVR